MRNVNKSPVIESLEHRQLRAGDPPKIYLSPDNTTLNMTGTTQDDTISIVRSGSVYTATVINSVDGTVSKQFTNTTINAFVVNGGAGTDNLSIDNLPAYPTGSGVEKVRFVDHAVTAGSVNDPSSLVESSNALGATQKAWMGKVATSTTDDTWFFGDSFAENFSVTTTNNGDQGGGASWNQDWAYRSLDLGVGGQTTQNMLYRIDSQGYFNQIAKQPKQVYVLAGTNNVAAGTVVSPQSSGTSAQIVAGIEKVVHDLKAKLRANFPSTWENTSFFLLDVSPERTYGVNDRATRINQQLSSDAPNVGYTFVNIYNDYLQQTPPPTADSQVNESYFNPDVHFNAAGYGHMSKIFLEEIGLEPGYTHGTV